MGSQTVSKLPAIDLTKQNLNPGSSLWVSTCSKIRQGLEEYGCMEVLYNKLPLEFHNKIFDAMKELFDLPKETKMKNINPKPAHGYIGKISALPLHEGLGIEYPTDLQQVENFTNLMWPAGNDHFCELAYAYANIAAELERMLMRMLFESYGAEKHHESHVASTTYLLRFLKYIKSQEDQTNIGFKGHTDKSFITILHQDHVKGLELRTKDGDWISYEPSPSSFLVVAGDVCMAWSNNRIKSCYHRVIVNEEEAVRHSLGFFTFRTGLIQPPEEVVDDEHPLQYKPFEHSELLKFYVASATQDKADRNMMKDFAGAT
ncbi:probable 2-oxoglutarate-dependent dioxygenase AOP1 [Tripterygium wilfordii]|uniref:probable 2-oxoglutarate-dependent dioxygenase AOP1 n=1 Tax=Tripterygium wilfordii TaxID=458696 RepID=UPI0018F83A6B|nr:probable 2-oxoglutarate-dependent dioxygenase AOP1 [Tripterygium wilfordii]